MVETATVEAAEDHLGFPYGLDEIEWLGCKFPDGVTVEARRRADLSLLYIFEGRHPDHGNRYFRARRRGQANGAPAAVEVWDVTEALMRYMVTRLKRSRRAQGRSRAERFKRVKVSAGTPRIGAPTPERRRRGTVARETIPNIDQSRGEPLNVDIHRAPDRLMGMHKRGTLSAAQLDAAVRFHSAFIAGGLDPARAANMGRVPGGAGNGLPDAMLDAQHEVFQIYDHVGGRQTSSGLLLRAIVGEDRSIDECVRLGRAEGWANKHRVAGALAAVLDSVSGYYATRGHLEALRRRALRGAEIGVLSMGA